MDGQQVRPDTYPDSKAYKAANNPERHMNMKNEHTPDNPVMKLIDEYYEHNGHDDLNMDTLTANLFKISQPLIKSVIRRYEKLDTVNEKDDFLNQSYLAVHNVVNSFRTNSGAKISSVLVWSIQKQCEKICPSTDKQVEVTYSDGVVTVMAYKKFQKIKKELLLAGAQWVVMSRYIPLDEVNGDNGFKE